MIQWVGILFTLLGLVYTGVKDYQKGDIKIPAIQKHLTVQKYPIQYCLMAYDPNVDKVFYLHENGQWYDYAPPQRRYSHYMAKYDFTLVLVSIICTGKSR
ncbi:MAG: hypothetical protein EBU08_11045 [Micrococcales bacterium]|nr:hypothetical protein [Micrococcales bacterium]